MTQLALQQWIGSQLIQVILTSGSADAGFASVVVNKQEVHVNDNMTFTDNTATDISVVNISVNINEMRLHYVDTHLVVIFTPLFVYEIYNSDHFVNNNVRPRVTLRPFMTHGLLGQTWSSRTYHGSIRYIEGEVDDYLVGTTSADVHNASEIINQQRMMFSNDFLFNLFGK